MTYLRAKLRAVNGSFTPSKQSDRRTPFINLERVLTAEGKDIRVWSGHRRLLKSESGRQDVGFLGERIVATLMHMAGIEVDRGQDNNNSVFDLENKRWFIEVKFGLVSNGPTAEHWRVTPGGLDRHTQMWLATIATHKEKKEFRRQEQLQMMQRRRSMMAHVSEATEKKLLVNTVTGILDTDLKRADIFVFDGVEERIRWRDKRVMPAYVGTFAYR